MSGWVRIDREALEDLVALAQEVGGVWRRGAVVALLTLAQDDAARPHKPPPFPGRRALCVRTGWGDWPMRQMLASDVWRDDHKPLPRSSQRPPKIPPAPSQDPPKPDGPPVAIGSDSSQRPPKILPAPSQDPPKILHTRVEDPQPHSHPTPTVTTTSSTDARPVPDLSAVPADLQPDMRRLLAEIATRQTPPRTADAVHRWIGVNPLRAAKLFETWRQLPPIPEVPHAEVPKPPPSDQPQPTAAGAEASATDAPARGAVGPPRPQLPAADALGEAHDPSVGGRPGDHAGGLPHPEAAEVPAVAGGAPERGGGAGIRDVHGGLPRDVIGGSADGCGRDGAGGDAAGRVDPDISTRRVAPPRWDDDPAWHAAAAAYVELYEAVTSRPAPQPHAGRSPVSDAIVAALTGALGRRYQRRLELLTAAARGEPSVAAAHEAIRVLREVWVPRDGTDTKAMATLVSARPAAYVAAVDAAIAEGAPLVPVPVPRVAGRQESPLERYLRECDQREGVIDGQ